MSRSDLTGFQPHRLYEALVKVRRRHLIPGEIEGLVVGDLLDRVRELLVATPESEIASLALRVSPAQLRAALQLLSLPEEAGILHKAEALVCHRPRKDLLKSGWTLLKNVYPAMELERTVKKLGFLLHWEGIARQPENIGRIERWFDASDLGDGILRNFQLDPGCDFDVWLLSREIKPECRIATWLWDEILRNADRVLIGKIGHEELLTKAKKRPEAIRTGFGRNYLVRLGGVRYWHESVLLWIKERWGVPPDADEALTNFWRPIPDEVRREFRRWAIEKTLLEFFGDIHDPNGRFVFWRGFLKHIRNAETVLAGSAALIDFGRFGVVEFAEVGNAAYVYPAQVFWQVKGHAPSASHPSWFKWMGSTVSAPHSGPTGSGRIIHTEGWQYRYAPWIQRLLGASVVS